MEVKVFDVKSNGVVVGQASVPIFASIDEAVEHYGNDEVLELINTQAKTTEMNSVRQTVTAATSGKATAKSLQAVLAKATSEQFLQIQAALNAGDEEATKELIKSILAA